MLQQLDKVVQVEFTDLPDHGWLEVKNAAGVWEVFGGKYLDPSVITGNNLRYRPEDGYVGTDSYKVRLIDTDGLKSIELPYSIRVSNINDAPISADIALSRIFQIDKAGTASELGLNLRDFSYYDKDGDALTHIQITRLFANNMILELNGTQITTANLATTGKIAVADLSKLVLKLVNSGSNVKNETSSYKGFEFKLVNGNIVGGNAKAESGTHSLYFSVNKAPVIGNLNVSVDSPDDGAASISFTKAFFKSAIRGDVDDLAAVILRSGFPAADNQGVLTYLDGNGDRQSLLGQTQISVSDLSRLRYEAKEDYQGHFTVTFALVDTRGGISNDATLRLGVDSAPVAENSSVAMTEETIFVFNKTHFKFSDADGDEIKTVELVRLPDAKMGELLLTNGRPVVAGIKLSLAELSQLRFIGAENATGTANFTFRITDSDGDTSASVATMTITIADRGERPTIRDNEITLNEDNSHTFSPSDFTSAYSDPEGNALASITITSLPLRGRLSWAIQM